MVIKHFILIFILLLIVTTTLRAQDGLNIRSNLKLKDKSNDILLLPGRTSKAGLPPFIVAGVIFLFINPELVIENKKVYFGLTKELSIGKYPYGRLAFEYSYLFRNYDRNHFRFSYNQDFIIETKGDFYTPLVSGGVGYFTDTEHKGIFLQGSAGIILPLPVGIFQGVYGYFKARHTFVKGTENSNITDFSLGMSFLIYY